jgi:CheY-like chemotaxis protein
MVTRMAPHTLGSILLIDDEPSLVRALARLLQRDGYIVATASNGRHALAALQGQRYDVILCDLRMPELDGRAFYAQLQQRAPALCQRVIFLTGDSSAADHQAFLAQCWPPLAGQTVRDRGAPAGDPAGAGACHTRVPALPSIPGIAAAESRAVGESADLICAESALAVPGRPAAAAGPDGGPSTGLVRPGRRSCRHRERQDKGCPLPLHTRHGDPTPMGDQNLPHNIEAQARAARLRGVERLENPRDLLGGYPNPAIMDAQLHRRGGGAPLQT